MSHPTVLIVGAGPTGLVLALSLARRGIPFRIVEQHGGPGEASRAMAVHARTLEFYRQFGFADEVVRRGIKMENIHLREGGEEVARFTLHDIGEGLSPYPYILSFPQDDHERFLIEQLSAAGHAVEWNTRLQSFVQDADGVRAVLAGPEGEATVAAGWLCGCDGAHSVVRHGLGVDFPGGAYEQLFYVADVRLAGEASPDMFINLGADVLLLLLPVRSSGMHRVIGLVPPALGTPDHLDFEAVRPSAEHLLGIRVAEVNWFSTYHVHHRVAQHFRVGRCFLAGDAGHIHSPAGGQGMNTGIGDAVNLAWKLAQVAEGRADPALLHTYETERIAFARTLVATTDRAFRGVVDGGLGGRLLRTWLLPHLLPFLAGFSATRRLMFRTVSQVKIAYHESALSAGEAGAVQGGDRLPWVPGEGGDNFAPLRSLDWQLHVFGDPDAEFAAAATGLGLPLHAFPWSAAADTAGLHRGAAYLVRPDGYVALAMPRQDPAALTGFLGALALRFRQP